MSNTMKMPRHSIRSVQFSSNYTTREENKGRSRSKFVKLPDKNAEEMIHRIESRLSTDHV